MKNVGDVLVRWEKTIGMHEAVCVNFAVVKRGILLFLYPQIMKEKSDKIKGEKIVTTIIHKLQLLV